MVLGVDQPLAFSRRDDVLYAAGECYDDEAVASLGSALWGALADGAHVVDLTGVQLLTARGIAAVAGVLAAAQERGCPVALRSAPGALAARLLPALGLPVEVVVQGPVA